jgi:hypothetical protein
VAPAIACGASVGCGVAGLCSADLGCPGVAAALIASICTAIGVLRAVRAQTGVAAFLWFAAWHVLPPAVVLFATIAFFDPGSPTRNVMLALWVAIAAGCIGGIFGVAVAPFAWLARRIAQRRAGRAARETLCAAAALAACATLLHATGPFAVLAAVTALAVATAALLRELHAVARALHLAARGWALQLVRGRWIATRTTTLAAGPYRSAPATRRRALRLAPIRAALAAALVAWSALVVYALVPSHP